MDWQAIESRLARQFGGDFMLSGRRPLGGGCINEAWALDTSLGPLFLKCNRPAAAAMFEAEWAGLCELRHSGAVRVPQPLAQGVEAEASWLLLEYIEWGADDGASAGRFGEQLATLHRFSAPEFGFCDDNFIGSTRQVNTPTGQWSDFFQRERLGVQLDLAARGGAPARLLRAVERVIALVPVLLAGHSPVPSLLHGDLWSGNVGTDRNGQPVIYDPAVYYGDRETDIAMTELFGPLPAAFYAAYQAAWPLADGYPQRRTLYNLYHVLNHYNLFGGGYARQAIEMCEVLCSA